MSDLITDIFSKLDNFGQTESSAADTTNNDENKVSVSAADVIARVRAKAQANANNNAAKEENNLSPPSA
ncbi:MAG: hypothetical protein IJ736_01995 [Firmicutes bacterium]|nr:hypothetical protein [Bacillota bacterium]